MKGWKSVRYDNRLCRGISWTRKVENIDDRYSKRQFVHDTIIPHTRTPMLHLSLLLRARTLLPHAVLAYIP